MSYERSGSQLPDYIPNSFNYCLLTVSDRSIFCPSCPVGLSSELEQKNLLYLILNYYYFIILYSLVFLPSCENKLLRFKDVVSKTLEEEAKENEGRNNFFACIEVIYVKKKLKDRKMKEGGRTMNCQNTKYILITKSAQLIHRELKRVKTETSRCFCLLTTRTLLKLHSIQNRESAH